MDGARLKPVVVLGATGSIGRQTFDVARRLGLDVVGMAAGRVSQSLLDLAGEWPAADVVAAATSDVTRTGQGRPIEFGADAIADLAGRAGVVVVNGIVGAAGLRPSVAALDAGNRLALANKESLIAGGPLVLAARDAGGGELIPIDSEHSALWQCLTGEPSDAVRRLILTASGGPFRGAALDDLGAVTVADALDHPTWSMGPRITIDSATLLNKAFEVIEAHHLFGTPYDQIDVVVHPQSIVHSLVEFMDGSVLAQLGAPDMRHPIQYAITYPQREPAPPTGFDLTATDLTFEQPGPAARAGLELGYRAGRAGGSAGAALNAADEVAVAAFLDGRIPFPAIVDVVGEVMETVPVTPVTSLADVTAADGAARAAATRIIERRFGAVATGGNYRAGVEKDRGI